MAKDKHLLHSVHHVLIAFVLLLKGYEKFTHHPILGGLIFSFGLLILLYFIYVTVTKTEGGKLSMIVHLFEGFALLFTSYIFFADGKQYLPYFTLAASIGFFISVYVSIKKGRNANPVQEKEWLFSYGTLQKAEVQAELFGRLLKGKNDSLTGYKILRIEISDESFLARREEKMQSTLSATGNKQDEVKGMVFQLSPEELLRADQYEPENYERVQITLRSGIIAWVYCAKTSFSSLNS